MEISLPQEELTLRFVAFLAPLGDRTHVFSPFLSTFFIIWAYYNQNFLNLSVVTVTFCLVNAGADVEDKL